MRYLFSCQPEGRSYVKLKVLSPDLEWLREDVKSFDVPIEDTAKVYRMSIAFRYANGYQFDELILNLKETSPSGTIIEFEKILKIRDEKGQYIGDPGFDIWDCEQIIMPQKYFNEIGNYSYLISHKMPVNQLHFWDGNWNNLG